MSAKKNSCDYLFQIQVIFFCCSEAFLVVVLRPFHLFVAANFEIKSQITWMHFTFMTRIDILISNLNDIQAWNITHTSYSINPNTSQHTWNNHKLLLLKMILYERILFIWHCLSDLRFTPLCSSSIFTPLVWVRRNSCALIPGRKVTRYVIYFPQIFILIAINCLVRSPDFQINIYPIKSCILISCLFPNLMCRSE